MGEVEKCPTCGIPVVMSWKLEQGQVLTQANGVVSGHYQRTVTHYEPMGGDADLRAQLAAAVHRADAAEELLREIQKYGQFDSGVLGMCSIKIDTLLGPAAEVTDG